MEKIVHYLLLSLKSTEGVTVSEPIVLVSRTSCTVPVVLAVSVLPGFARSLKVWGKWESLRLRCSLTLTGRLVVCVGLPRGTLCIFKRKCAVGGLYTNSLALILLVFRPTTKRRQSPWPSSMRKRCKMKVTSRTAMGKRTVML